MGEGDRDFGVVQTANRESELAVSTQFLGTPEFASPEQMEGRQLDTRSDIYSLGVMLWYALSGNANSVRHHSLPVAQLRELGIPSRLVKLLESMRATDPHHRPSSAVALIEALKVCLESSSEANLMPASPFLGGGRKRAALVAVDLAAAIAGPALFSLLARMGARRQIDCSAPIQEFEQ